MRARAGPPRIRPRSDSLATEPARPQQSPARSPPLSKAAAIPCQKLSGSEQRFWTRPVPTARSGRHFFSAEEVRSRPLLAARSPSRGARNKT